MHRAPVVGIVVLDGHGAPLPEPLEVAHDLARSPDMQGSHHLLVISEEQFKVRKNKISISKCFTALNSSPVLFSVIHATVMSPHAVCVSSGVHAAKGER